MEVIQQQELSENQIKFIPISEQPGLSEIQLNYQGTYLHTIGLGVLNTDDYIIDCIRKNKGTMAVLSHVTNSMSLMYKALTMRDELSKAGQTSNFIVLKSEEILKNGSLQELIETLGLDPQSDLEIGKLTSSIKKHAISTCELFHDFVNNYADSLED